MPKTQIGTIAQLVYADKQPLNFARLVGDLHSNLLQLHGPELSFAWDCEDIAFFDLASTRISLGWDDRPGKGYSACMTVSVGPLPKKPQMTKLDGDEEMCSQLVERLQSRFPAIAILWHQTEERITSDLIDRLVEELPPLMQLFPFQEPDWVADAMARQSPSRAVTLRGAESASEPVRKEAAPISQSAPVSTPLPAAKAMSEPVVNLAQWRDEKGTELVAPKYSTRSASTRERARARAKAQYAVNAAATVPTAANDFPSFHKPRSRELAQLRDALYTADPENISEPLSPQLRLAVHALNATLIVVWAPLGAAIMTYSLLKGEDMKLSARLIVLVGLFATAINGPIGHQMAAIAGA